MKVVLINTAEDKGGAAVACNRLHHALRQNNISSDMLVRQKNTTDPHVHEFSTSSIRKKINLFFFFIELLILRFTKKKGKDFSLPWFGPDLSKHPLVRNADVIHLHWTQNSFLSLKNLEKILALNKPVIWTLHDMWAFTGGCHYTGSCEKFMTECHHCPVLEQPTKSDFSNSTFNRKKKIYSRHNFLINPLNQWMAQEVQKSALLQDKPFRIIPNCIDTELFKPVNKTEARKRIGLDPTKKIILFVSMTISDERKGFRYFREAIELLHAEHPGLHQQVELVTVGRNSGPQDFPFRINYIDRVNDQQQMAAIYSAADILVVPSLQDNLPNTIVESMACGTPVVAFRSGGIPEMYTHLQEGYLATALDSRDLMNGIFNALNNTDSYAVNCRKNAVNKYSYTVIASAFKELYSGF